jgi:hypothetical protein
MTKKPSIPSDLADLTPLERARKLPLAEAAAYLGVHIDTVKRNYPHLLVRIGKRRWGVSVGDIITLPPPRD